MARPARLGLTREGIVLVPLALVLLMAVSGYTLLTYSNALEWMTEEARDEAARVAREVVQALPPGTGGSAGREVSEGTLRRAAAAASRGRALGVAVIGGDGELRAVEGDLPAGPLLAPLEAEELGADGLSGPWAGGPGAGAPGRVVGFAPLGATAGDGLLRVDLPAPMLAAELARLRVLRVVVIGVDVALLVLVLLFLRHLLTPYEQLLKRARKARGPEVESEEEDEITFLLTTFDRALEALQGPAATEGESLRLLGETLGGSLASGLLLLDGEGRVQAVNPVGAELLGIPRPAAGTPLGAALERHPELAGRLQRAVTRGEELRRAECRVGPHTLGLTVHSLGRSDEERGDRENGDSAGQGFLVLFADLTEARRREQESRLAEGLAQLGAMAAGVAHELRNSLGTLKGYLSLAERGAVAEGQPGAAEEIGEYLGEIRRESEHLERILRDFLAFARPGTARPEDVDLAALLERIVRDPALAGAKIRLDIEGGRGLSLRADPELLERAVKNLLANAVEAQGSADGSPGGPSGGVHLALVPREGEVEIRIEDRGPGLPPEVRERLFTPFVTGRPGGVGLGLALAHRIATLHGGRLGLEDRSGGGTRARLRLPVTPGESAD